jgi:hypothetical protein
VILRFGIREPGIQVEWVTRTHGVIYWCRYTIQTGIIKATIKSRRRVQIIREAAGRRQMDLTFERGDASSPRGHALVYFRDTTNPDAVAATYLILLPVSVNLQKYVPPFLAGQMPMGGEADLSAFAFPPAPEPVESYNFLVSIAEARGDDLIFAGNRSLSDAAQMMGVIGEILAEYGSRYQIETPANPQIDTHGAAANTADSAASGTPGPAQSAGNHTVDDVVYAMMNEADQLGELTKLTGRLRFAAEGGDEDTAGDATAHMRAIATHVAANRHIDLLIKAALDKSEVGGQLAQLYLERAYALYREDYLRVKALDENIERVGS